MQKVKQPAGHIGRQTDRYIGRELERSDCRLACKQVSCRM